MPVSRNGDFQILDYTGLFEVTPRVNKLVTSMGFHAQYFGSTTVAQIERVVETTDSIVAKQRGGERTYASSEVATIKNFNIPFFPLDRQISRQDIQNFRAYGDPNAPKTVQQEVDRVMRRLRRSHANLIEKALITAMFGASYAPGDANATYSWFTEWGVSQKDADINFTTATVNPADVIEKEARKHIIANAGDNADEYRIMALCSPTWFSGFISHLQGKGKLPSGLVSPGKSQIGHRQKRLSRFFAAGHGFFKGGGRFLRLSFHGMGQSGVVEGHKVIRIHLQDTLELIEAGGSVPQLQETNAQVAP
jgi:hypothetical protein